MYRCLPNELHFFIQKAGYGHRLLFNISSCQVTSNDRQHLPCYQEDGGRIFKKYPVQTPLIPHSFCNDSLSKHLISLPRVRIQN